MSITNICEDARGKKTENALYAALFSLLKNNSFKKITIKNICEEAFISRAAFYAHFIDKYDLLMRWMTASWPKILQDNDSCEQIEETANHIIRENMAILKNLFLDADNDTFLVLFEFFLTTINLTVEKNDNNDKYSKNVVLANFYSGGIISYFLWQIKNKFPSEVPPVNKHFYEMISMLQNTQLS